MVGERSRCDDVDAERAEHREELLVIGETAEGEHATSDERFVAGRLELALQDDVRVAQRGTTFAIPAGVRRVDHDVEIAVQLQVLKTVVE